MEKIKTNPLIETNVKRACFLEGSLMVYPCDDLKIPANYDKVVRYLFGEGARITEGNFNGHYCWIINGASFEIRNSTTINADYVTSIVEKETI